jgi:hypothetical protein
MQVVYNLKFFRIKKRIHALLHCFMNHIQYVSLMTMFKLGNILGIYFNFPFLLYLEHNSLLNDWS